jgi:hypothetical protein
LSGSGSETGYSAISSGGQSRIDGSAGSIELLLGKSIEGLDNCVFSGSASSSTRQEHKSRQEIKRRCFIAGGLLIYI